MHGVAVISLQRNNVKNSQEWLSADNNYASPFYGQCYKIKGKFSKIVLGITTLLSLIV